MLVDSKLPTTFWTEAVNTASYVLNRALVIKPHNKTPYELICGRPSLIDFMKPFGCLVTILNTRDYLGKFDEKADETLNIRFLKNAPNVKGNGPDWLFDIDSLTISINYVPVVAGFQTNAIAGTKDNIVAGPKDSVVDARKKATEVDESQVSNNGGQDDQVISSEFEGLLQKERQTEHINNTNSFNTVSSPVNTAGPSFVNAALPSPINVVGTPAIARIKAIWIFLAYASFKDFVVYKMDVKSAFLYEKIEEEKSDGILLRQEKYVADILKKFDVSTIKTASTPIEPNKSLIKDVEVEDVDVHLYRSMIGLLMYLTTSKLDITFAVCACVRFQVTPNTLHLHAIKRTFRYLKDETFYKEWEDIMKMAATNASTLEAEQDSGNINRTQSMETLNEPLP
nr:hypothetical protein [Tanacetum cinerariifolium]